MGRWLCMWAPGIPNPGRSRGCFAVSLLSLGFLVCKGGMTIAPHWRDFREDQKRWCFGHTWPRAGHEEAFSERRGHHHCLKYELTKEGDFGALPGQTISMSCRVGGVEHESTLTSRSCILLEMVLNSLYCSILRIETRAVWTPLLYLPAPSLRAHVCQALGKHHGKNKALPSCSAHSSLRNRQCANKKCSRQSRRLVGAKENRRRPCYGSCPGWYLPLADILEISGFFGGVAYWVGGTPGTWRSAARNTILPCTKQTKGPGVENWPLLCNCGKSQPTPMEVKNLFIITQAWSLT